MIRVFYDGACGLCSKEIKYYQKIAPANSIQWCDIMAAPEQLEGTQLTQIDALKKLYAQDQDGTMHVGVDAFILIWSQLKHWRQLARLVNLPVIYTLTQWAYSIFAHLRFKRSAHCQVHVK